MTNVLTIGSTLENKNLIAEDLRQRLIARIAKENSFLDEDAREIVDGALGFLKLCADYPQYRFVPSRWVDLGWRAFLMYTREYQEFCQRFAGRFIHHEPTDNQARARVSSAHQTVAFMRKHKIPFCEEVWVSDCSTDPSCE